MWPSCCLHLMEVLIMQARMAAPSRVLLPVGPCHQLFCPRIFPSQAAAAAAKLGFWASSITFPRMGQQSACIAVPAWSKLELSVLLLLLQVSLNYLADLHQMHEEWITQGQKPGSFSSDMVRRNADCCWQRSVPARNS